jgi:hypothetical protein
MFSTILMMSKEAEWPADWRSVFERFHSLVVPAQRNNEAKIKLRWGLCHEMNIFLKVLKIKSVFSAYAPMDFENYFCLVMDKIEDKALACFYENTY